jgi:hypothetical protein
MDFLEQLRAIRAYIHRLNTITDWEYEKEGVIVMPWFDSDPERRAAVEEAERIIAPNSGKE